MTEHGREGPPSQQAQPQPDQLYEDFQHYTQLCLYALKNPKRTAQNKTARYLQSATHGSDQRRS
ncbi:uncharacterized protein METZ01_LOCUS474966, partial [marine metagenome]